MDVPRRVLKILPAPEPADVGPEAEPEPTARPTVYEEHPPVLVPYRAPKAWRPVFTSGTVPWTDFVLRLPEVDEGAEALDSDTVDQVTAETAWWVLGGAMVELRDEPDEARVPGIGERFAKLKDEVEEWRSRFFEEQPESDDGAPAPWHDLPADPREDIAKFAKRLLVDDPPDSGGGGGGGADDESDAKPERPERKSKAPAKAPSQVEELVAQLIPSQRHFNTGSRDPSVDPAKLEKLARDFTSNPDWRKFLDLIGRVSSDAWAPPAVTTTAARENVRDLEVGADLPRLLATEIARFGVPELAHHAYVDFVEKRMLQIAMDGHEPLARGPILVAIDVSPSMENASGVEAYDRMTIAQVLAVALVRIADVQNRKVFIVGFHQSVAFELDIQHAAQRVEAMERLLHLGTSGSSTEFDPPLRKLMEASRKYAGGDLLVITDGAAVISNPVATELDAQRRAGLRVFTLLIGMDTSPLAKHSDKVVVLKSAADLESLGKDIANAPARKA